MHKVKYIECGFEIKSLDEKGSFSGYGSVFNEIDSYNERVAKGAFIDSLNALKAKNRMPAMLWQHNSREPIGIYTLMKEDEYGLYVEGTLALKTQRGAEAYELLKMKAISGMSIGYTVDSYEYDKVTDIYTLTKINLWEVSLVTFPANDSARVDNVKNDIPSLRETEIILRDAGFSRSQAKTLLSKGYDSLSLRDADSEIINSLKNLENLLKTNN